MLGLSLSVDALAVSISTGVCVPLLRKRDAVKIAAFFGGFQFLMPLLGWLLGSTIYAYISALDHWIAFGLLAFIGIKLVVDAVRDKGGEECPTDMLSTRVLLTMAVATSIDALAVGISLAMVKASVVSGASIIGATTFAVCFFGAVFGKRLGRSFGKKAEIAGGLVLVVIGLKILIEHLLGNG